VASDRAVVLRGYGVELRPNNYSMEYTNTSGSSWATGPETPDLPLFELKHIAYRKERANITGLAPGLVHFARSCPDPFAALIDVCQNYPLFGHRLRGLATSPAFAEGVLKKPSGIVPGQNALYVNGRNVPTADAFRLLDASLDELRMRQMLVGHFGLQSESVTAALYPEQLRAPNLQVVIDARNNYQYSMNDLEVGPVYRDWPTSMSVFVAGGTRSEQVPRVRKNVYQALVLLDPMRKSDLSTLKWMDQAVREGAGVKFSYIVESRNQSRLARRLHFAWVHLRLKHTSNPERAHNFLLAVAQLPQPLKESDVRTAYESNRGEKWKEITTLLEGRSRESKHIRRTSAWLTKRGLAGPGMLFNGVFYPGKHPERKLEKAHKRSVARLRELVLAGQFRNSSRFTEDILFAQDDVYPKLNALVQINPRRGRPEFLGLLQQSSQSQQRFMAWAKAVRYTLGANASEIRFGTLWVFVGEGLTHGEVASMMARQVEGFVQVMKPSCRVGWFCDGDTHNLAQNPRAPRHIEDLLDLRPDEVTVVFNGRVLRLNEHQVLSWRPEDFECLVGWERFQQFNVERLFTEDLIAYDYSALGPRVDELDAEFSCNLALYLALVHGHARHAGLARANIGKLFEDFQTNAVYRYPSPDAQLRITAILNPFTREFQALAPIVERLRSPAVDVTIWLNFPTLEPKDLSGGFDSFHRFVLDGEAAEFDRFESGTIYSVLSHTPVTWTVEADSKLDSNNIRAEVLPPGVTEVGMHLRSVVSEGFVSDEQGKPLGSVWVTAGSGGSSSLSRLGYVQVRGLPGLWNVTAKGLSAQGASELVLSSFVPFLGNIRVNETEVSWEVSSSEALSSEGGVEEETLHVFAVVGGALYERLVKIMMISVVRHASCPVKFWLLRNFLSRELHQDLRVLAEKYKFTYEFVEYRWPDFVPAQSERNREIWGFKILFLDAIFPLTLKRVIYLDADAVVRGDLAPLMTVDLRAAPYAFVPFCTSRTEMKPFHFWTTGYWKKHLGKSKQYHISALFVVDLERFRRMRAGDYLRKRYTKLFYGKPGSLANLDQDLPNDGQEDVPIFSLHKRWLWCCTWCSEQDKDEAVVIDLANNPKSKLSKVDMARAFIEEWDLLDEEAAHLADPHFFANYSVDALRAAHKAQLERDL
jgi:UDP-glucose:glycoprotein glucosyltransferase